MTRAYHVHKESGAVYSFVTKEEAIKFMNSCDQGYQCGCFWWYNPDRNVEYDIPVAINTDMTLHR